MKKMLARCLALAALTFAAPIYLAAPARAQALPGGSYQRSCTQIHWSGTTLVAECRKVDGRMTGTGLPNANRCVGDIGNNNGQLQCNYAGGTPSPGAAQPPRNPAPQPGYGAPQGGGPGYGGPGYEQPRGGPGYGGYEERRARCDELWRQENDLRGRIQYTFGPERERLEYRLREVHNDRERLGCR